MTHEEAINDLNTIKEFFEQESGAYPVSLEYAIKVLKNELSLDRPQGEWIDRGRNLWGCSNCGMEIYSESEQDRNEFHKWCSRCGAQMKGADNE